MKRITLAAAVLLALLALAACAIDPARFDENSARELPADLSSIDAPEFFLQPRLELRTTESGETLPHLVAEVQMKGDQRLHAVGIHYRTLTFEGDRQLTNEQKEAVREAEQRAMNEDGTGVMREYNGEHGDVVELALPLEPLSPEDVLAYGVQVVIQGADGNRMSAVGGALIYRDGRIILV